MTPLEKNETCLDGREIPPVLENAGKRQITDCEICGTSETSFLFKKKDKFGIDPEPFSVVRCKKCGLVYVNPRPAPSEIGRFYPEFYQWKETEEKPTGLGAVSVRLEKAYRYHQLRSEIKKMRQHLPAGRLKILDIGCGTGDRLHLLEKSGYDVWGVETSDQAHHAAGHFNLTVFQGTLDAAGYQDSFFDVITLHNVLEHVHHPREILKEVRRILKPGGRVAIQVPDERSFQARFFKARWAAVDVPRDLFYFNKQTLGRLIKEAGFLTTKIDGTTDFWHPPTLVISLFPGLDPQLIWSRDRNQGGGILSRILWAFWTLLLAPLVYLEGLLGGGALMTFYVSKDSRRE